MHQEDLGFAHLRACTGGLKEGDVVGGMNVGAVNVGASTQGALIGIASLVTVLVGATWLRRRTVNTYVGASQSFAEEDDYRAKMIAKFWPGRQGVPRPGAPAWIQDEFLRKRIAQRTAGEPREESRVIYDPAGRPQRREGVPMRRTVVEMGPSAIERRSTTSTDPMVLEERAASIGEGKGLVAPWVERRGNKLVVIGVDPLPRFERQERRGPGAETYEAAVGVAGAFKIRSFEIPLVGDRLGAPSPVSDATPTERGAYRQNVPPEAFSPLSIPGGPKTSIPGGAKTVYRYPWENPSFAPKDFNQVRAEFRAYKRRQREAKKGT